MKYLKNIQVGNYELECSASGYGSQTKRITIEESKTTISDIKLSRGRLQAAQSGAVGPMTDQDGNVYKTVKIGRQVWLAENLKITHYRNGDPIPNVTNDSEWSNLITGAYSAYNNDNGHVATYGLLYNGYAVNDRRNIAPAGWHVPTDAEWKQLEKYLGMNNSETNVRGWRGSDEGDKLKEAGTTHWESPNEGATNSSGFTALPGGYRGNYGGAFLYLGYYGYWWSSTEYGGDYAWYRCLGYSYSAVYRYYGNKQNGFSVRLVRD